MIVDFNKMQGDANHDHLYQQSGMRNQERH